MAVRRRKIVVSSFDKIESDPSLKVSPVNRILIIACVALIAVVSQAMAF